MQAVHTAPAAQTLHFHVRARVQKVQRVPPRQLRWHRQIHAWVQVPSRQYSQGVAQGLKAILDTDSTRGADLMAAYNHMALTEGAGATIQAALLPCRGAS